MPHYGQTPAFDLSDLRLSFRSPFRIRYALRLPFQLLVNLTRWGQEFYEEFLTPFMYCYQLEYTLVRNESALADEGVR